MSDEVLLSAGRHNINECIVLAQEQQLGVEVMAFAYPDVLDGDWRGMLDIYQRKLAQVPGRITLHGPFLDMVSGSPDERIASVCRQRYHHAIDISAELGARTMVVHANFIGTLHNTVYREGWHQRSVRFWRPIAEYAQRRGVTIAMENMWEFDPTIISDLLSEVDHPHLKACIDIGHAHLFSDVVYTLNDWLTTLEPWLIHSHMNNNNGRVDVHHGFSYADGVLNYNAVLPMIRALKKPPPIVLEMDNVADMRASLSYLELPAATPEVPPSGTPD